MARPSRLVGAIVCLVVVTACGASAPSATIASITGGESPASSTDLLVRLSHARLPTPTTRGVAFATGSNILLSGGLTVAGTTGTVVRIPTSGGPIATVGRLRYPVHDAAGVMLGGSMLLFGGGVSTQDAWVQRVVGGGRSVIQGRLPTPRADLGAVVVGSEAIVVGGGAGGRADARVLATNDGVHFRVVARLPVAVRYAAVAAVGSTVFVIGGAASTGDVGTIQIVDVVAGAARLAGRLPLTLSHATALTIAGSIVVAGGRHAGRALDAIFTIDPTTVATRTMAHLPQPMSDAAGIVVGGVGYLIGGEDARPLSTIVTITAS